MEDLGEEHGVWDVLRFEGDLDVKKLEESHGDQ